MTTPEEAAQMSAILIAYADGELPADKAAEIAKRLDSDEAFRARLEEVRRDQSQLRVLLQRKPAPVRLDSAHRTALLQQLEQPEKTISFPWWRMGTIAAGLAACLVVMISVIQQRSDQFHNNFKTDELAYAPTQEQAGPKNGEGELVKTRDSKSKSDVVLSKPEESPIATAAKARAEKEEAVVATAVKTLDETILENDLAAPVEALQKEKLAKQLSVPTDQANNSVPSPPSAVQPSQDEAPVTSVKPSSHAIATGGELEGKGAREAEKTREEINVDVTTKDGLNDSQSETPVARRLAQLYAETKRKNRSRNRLADVEAAEFAKEQAREALGGNEEGVLELGNAPGKAASPLVFSQAITAPSLGTVTGTVTEALNQLQSQVKFDLGSLSETAQQRSVMLAPAQCRSVGEAIIEIARSIDAQAVLVGGSVLLKLPGEAQPLSQNFEFSPRELAHNFHVQPFWQSQQERAFPTLLIHNRNESLVYAYTQKQEGRIISPEMIASDEFVNGVARNWNTAETELSVVAAPMQYPGTQTDLTTLVAIRVPASSVDEAQPEIAERCQTLSLKWDTDKVTGVRIVGYQPHRCIGSVIVQKEIAAPGGVLLLEVVMTDPNWRGQIGMATGHHFGALNKRLVSLQTPIRVADTPAPILPLLAGAAATAEWLQRGWWSNLRLLDPARIDAALAECPQPEAALLRTLLKQP